MAMPGSPEHVIFDVARKLDSAASRDAYLHQACGGDRELSARLRGLLRNYDENPDFLEGSPLESKTSPAHGERAFERPGMAIDAYRLVQQLGVGGMGMVYLAEQMAPVRRQVALKIIKPGMDTREVISRFETERQTLAMMDHPNIAQVFDAGSTHAGRPYFVMELVRGIPITDYCDQHRMPMSERLELFITVCSAVQHAHQKGIIHRDIKPSNVMVTLHDEKPVVKIIDFGIAKAVSQQAGESTSFTQFSQMVGTPLYMSREQVEPSGVDVDTRTDVYSLGVLLYEILTGTTPFEPTRLRQASLEEIRRIVRDEEPPRPSMRVALMESVKCKEIATRRQLDPIPLVRRLRGDLDWIVTKALEKERERRYETVNELAKDVRCSLRDEPVAASPPSATYRLRKFSRRNRGVLTIGMFTAASLVIGVIGLAVSNTMIRAAQTRTQQERTRAVISQRKAEFRAEQLRQGSLDLQTAHQLLERGRLSLSEQCWDDAWLACSRAIELRPEYAGPWGARADVYLELGLFDLGMQDLTRAYELQESAQSHRSMRLAMLRLRAGDVKGYCEVSAHLRKHFRGTASGGAALDMIRTVALLPDPEMNVPEQMELAESLLARDTKNPFLHFVWGLTLFRAEEWEPAAHEFQQALSLSPDWPARHTSRPLLAMAWYQLGRKPEARIALDEAAQAVDEMTNQICLKDNGRWRVNQGAGNWPVGWWDWVECCHYYREAKQMIDGISLPDDPRIHVLHARAWSGLRQTAKAMAEYDTALQQLPGERQVAYEMHRTRGYSLGYRDWHRAAHEFSEARQLMPAEAGIWTFEAISQLAAGNHEVYRQLCSEIVRQFSATEDPGIANDIVAACVLSPEANVDSEPLLRLAHVATRLHHGNDRIVGAACYRTGDFAQAAKEIEKSTRIRVPRAWEWCFLAMAHHRLGHDEQARIYLRSAKDWMTAADEKVSIDDPPPRAYWSGFTERFEFPLLYAEAQALIDSQETVSPQDRNNHR